MVLAVGIVVILRWQWLGGSMRGFGGTGNILFLDLSVLMLWKLNNWCACDLCGVFFVYVYFNKSKKNDDSHEYNFGKNNNYVHVFFRHPR